MSVDIYNHDYVTTDPCVRDPLYPPYFASTSFMSDGTAVQATIWVAQGKGAKGCVVISPQIYGGENVESAIPALQSAGIHVLTFHPRGMYDNRNRYTIGGAVDDIHAAVAWLRSNGGVHEPYNGYGNFCEIDTSRIALMGCSGGGGAASFAVAAEDPLVNFAIALAPSNPELLRGGNVPGERERAEELDQHFAKVKKATAGRIDLADILQQTSQSDLDRVSIIKRAPDLVSKTMLIISGSYCTFTPVDLNHRPIVDALRAAGAQRLTDIILETDALFISKRIALARIITTWLKKECGF